MGLFYNLLVASVAVSLAGCTSVGKVASAERPVPITVERYGTDPIKKPGLIYAWPPYVSAAVVDEEGNRCVLAASGAKTLNVESDLTLKLEQVEKMGIEAGLKEKLIESFIKISQADADAAFADIALFHLCMLDQNGTFGDKDNGQMKPKAVPIMDAYLTTIEMARSHRTSQESGRGK